MSRYNLLLAFLFATSTNFAQQNDVAFAENDTIKEIETDTVKKKKSRILDEVQINFNKTKKTPSAGKANIKAFDLPQATAIIGKETIEQQQIFKTLGSCKKHKRCLCCRR